MKKSRIISIAAGTVLSLGLAVSGALAAEQSAPAAVASTLAQVQGSISSVDLKQQPPQIVVKGASGLSWSFLLDPKVTTVWRNGSAKGLSELALGEQVKVRYDKQGVSQVAKSIEIVASASAAPSVPAGTAGQK